MNDQDALEITVKVSLVDHSHDVDEDRLARQVQTSLQTMANDLELPIRIDATVTHSNGSNLDGGAYSVRVGSLPCRTDVPASAIPAEFDIISLTRAIHGTVFANRHLLAPEAVIRRLAHEADPRRQEAVRRALRLCRPQGVVRKASVDAVSGLSEFAFLHRLEQMFGPSDALVVDVGIELFDRVSESTARIDSLIKTMREAVFFDLGLKAPLIRIMPDRCLREEEAAVGLGAVSRAAHFRCPSYEYLFQGDVQDGKGRPALHPVHGRPSRVLTREDLGETDHLERPDVHRSDWYECFVLNIEGHIRRHADAFFTLHSLEEALAYLADAFPLLIVDVIERFPLSTLLDVHRYLLSEGWSVRDLRSILEALLEVNEVQPPLPRGEVLFTPSTLRLAPGDAHTAAGDIGVREYGAYVRGARALQTMRQHALAGVSLAVETSEATEKAIRSLPDEIDPAAHDELIRTVVKAFDQGRGWETPTLITASDVRRRLWELVRIDFPHVKVLSRQEVTRGDSCVRAFAEIDWAPMPNVV